MDYEIGSVTAKSREPAPTPWKQREGKSKEVVGDPMPACERKIWSAFLDYAFEEDDFSDFAEHEVPGEVYAKYADVMEAFDYCQIWVTSSGKHPMLLGFRENEDREDDCWMIARWNPTGSLIPIEDVKKIVRRRAHMHLMMEQNRRYLRRWFPEGIPAGNVADALVWTTLFLPLLLLFIRALSEVPPDTIWNYVFYSSGSVLWFSLWCWQLKHSLRPPKRKEDPVERACDEHDSLAAQPA